MVYSPVLINSEVIDVQKEEELNGDVTMNGEKLMRVENFKYLGSVISEDGKVDEEIILQPSQGHDLEGCSSRIQAAEMRCVRSTFRKTRLNRIRNEEIRNTIKVERLQERIEK